MIKRHLILIVLSFSLTLCMGQESKIDSLNLKLAKAEGIQKARVLYELASCYIDRNLSVASEFLDQAQLINEEDYDDEVQAYIWKYRSEIEEKKLSGSGTEWLKKATELFQVTANYHETAWCCRKLGIHFFQQGNYDKALSYFLISQRNFEKENYLPGIEATENNMGGVHYRMKNLDEALKHYNRVLELNKLTHDSTVYYKAKSNIGLVYQDKGNYDSALVLYNEAARGFARSNDYFGLTSVNNNIALVYNFSKNFKKAEYYQRKALKYAELSNSAYIQSVALVNLGAIYSELSKTDSAFYFLELGKKMADSLGFQDIYMEALSESANAYYRSGNFKKAYLYRTEAAEISEQISGQEVISAIAELSASHVMELNEKEFEKIRNQNDLQSILFKIFILLFALVLVIFFLTRLNLRSKKKSNQLLIEKNDQLNEINNQLKISEEKLKSINSSKDRLFSIVAHDLRNPVAAVSGFSELLESDFDKLDDTARKEYLSQIIQGVQRTQTLLENLLIWSRSQMKAVRYQPDFHPLCILIDDSIKPLKSNISQKKLNIVSECKGNIDIYVDREMILTILRNLVMNAIKFSFPGGVIEVKAYHDEQFCYISVEDHGIGIQPELQEKLLDKTTIVHSTPGTSGESGSGLGMPICLEFAEMNRGSIIIDSIPGRGSKFILRLPMDLPVT